MYNCVGGVKSCDKLPGPLQVHWNYFVAYKSWLRLLPYGIRTQMEGRPTLQKIVANIGWLFADKILRMGLGLLVNIWMARYLGPSQFGLFNYTLAFVAIFSSVAGLGLDGIVVRDIVRDPAGQCETLGSAFLLRLAGGLCTMLLAILAIALLRHGDAQILWLVGISAASAVFQAFDPIDFWFQAQVRSKYVVYARNAAFVLIGLLKITLILIQAPLVTFAWAGLAEVALGSAGLVVYYHANGQYLKAWQSSWKRAKLLLHDSWPLVLSGLAVYVHARIDQVMLGQMIGDAEVGQYSAAMMLIETFGFIPMVVAISVAPEVTRARIAGQDVYFNLLLNLYRLVFILFLITAVPIYLFSDQAVALFYGKAYDEAGTLLSLFALRLFFTNMGTIKNLYITNENMFRYSMATAIVGSCANVMLNYLLIPQYKAVGAIWAMIVSYFIGTFVLDIFFVEVRKNLRLMALAVITPWKIKVT